LIHRISTFLSEIDREKIRDALQFYFPINPHLVNWLRSLNKIAEIFRCKKLKIDGFVYKEGIKIKDFSFTKGQFIEMEPPVNAPETAWYGKIEEFFTYKINADDFVWMKIRFLELSGQRHPITDSDYCILSENPEPRLLSPQVLKGRSFSSQKLLLFFFNFLWLSRIHGGF
jgi:hypothetical protein